ncbi:Undecaprenyl pyrophosphate synthetase [Candidatus Kryptobacter tengchongensis]|uniref:Isoprenyl transferase n=1 Tax=Kryptobacter tengchongensis TaxID=1643429 RepID=A0A656D2Y8_KRYT1|nr:isoprenyl transferase [Candidatus Kryptobacter tengchongensis]CUS96538.1 Undecaprenyl pyrophosphate synthetase [Candidatus Kryptobacter tengchongensis]CUS99717.1 Undecaprenyl pyrophosphate synthetase [Candidatus Kryptobacter tengchongensis]CUT03362.1 Undecaprenyl pyrophosphate synthetase [Candidatus Kryptobacter tengchongensis]CUU04630.1 Undecaprenyl pyrophosphate synthetase [Candidatus Kryptobacter tengchongensis]
MSDSVSSSSKVESKSSYDRRIQEELKKSGEIPKHIAIIMDGNGRWAKKRGLPRVAGHREGVKSVRDVVEACAQLGVKYLTLFAFSTENWKRPKHEIDTLMKLLIKTLRTETDKLHKNDIKLMAIGDIESLPVEVQRELKEAIEKTKNNKRMVLNLALSYSGRWEIIEAVKGIARDVKSGKIKVEEINDSLFASYLKTAGIPEPDLLIRTSGEFRISNFLLWQIAYTELYICDCLWPDFRRKHLYEAIRDYQKRERRFGMTSEQIKKKSFNGNA